MYSEVRGGTNPSHKSYRKVGLGGNHANNLSSADFAYIFGPGWRYLTCLIKDGNIFRSTNLAMLILSLSKV